MLKRRAPPLFAARLCWIAHEADGLLAPALEGVRRAGLHVPGGHLSGHTWSSARVGRLKLPFGSALYIRDSNEFRLFQNRSRPL